KVEEYMKFASWEERHLMSTLYSLSIRLIYDKPSCNYYIRNKVTHYKILIVNVNTNGSLIKYIEIAILIVQGFSLLFISVLIEKESYTHFCRSVTPAKYYL